MGLIQYYGTGKRKTAVARVYLRPGKGNISLIVNKRPRAFDEYFSLETQKILIKKPLQLTGTTDKFDLLIRVDGGGINAQADAIKLGIARALVDYNKELRPILKKEGLLTRDAREKERKKYGLRGARKAPQYHKR
ncbi:30S ribosomal protein S9 [Candidatus Aminicenantes bacterium AC-335-A11]|jgi:small subunit ribosomal protein S9|nr:30S ribosomal protein S9 [SCandidatus Aminicenantes bacterium Aminicenantia_JdfR_composite]MCP2618454.1 30S ribosomal protein S9 [Candidatus Aminicenantes bacterium AC-335-A11]